ncbi:MAG TPA: thermonuclease family protein [Sphingomonas sp.]|nr:thermonuclease family protein [Sphingomonas sp.]
MRHDSDFHRARRAGRRRRGRSGTLMLAAAALGLALTIAMPERARDVLDDAVAMAERARAAADAPDAPSPPRPTGTPVAARSFGLCFTGGGTNCVVDGDTFWIDGEKIRVADIDAPETHPPRCAEEARLGKAATERLRALLNAGPVTLVAADRDVDRYGRKLRIVERDGHSLGAMLVSEGLAREWGGRREPWC